MLDRRPNVQQLKIKFITCLNYSRVGQSFIALCCIHALSQVTQINAFEGQWVFNLFRATAHVL